MCFTQVFFLNWGEHFWITCIQAMAEDASLIVSAILISHALRNYDGFFDNNVYAMARICLRWYDLNMKRNLSIKIAIVCGRIWYAVEKF